MHASTRSLTFSLLLAGLLGGVLSACYSTPQPNCAFLCGPSNECPGGYQCGGDQRCHLLSNGQPLACTDSFPGDARPADGPVPDARADATPPVDASPVDASPDANLPDSGFDARPQDAGQVLSATSVIPVSLFAGAQGNVLVSFTVANPWPPDGKLKLTLGAITGPTEERFNATTATASSSIGSLTVSVTDAQHLVVTRTSGAWILGGTPVVVTLGSIKNPIASGLTGTFVVSTTDAADVLLDTATAGAVTIVAQTLVSPTVTPVGSLVAGAAPTSLDVAFTPINAWPLDGQAVITFNTGPASQGFDVSGVTATATATGADGTFAVAAVGQVVTVTRTGTTAASGAVTLHLTGIKNPPITGDTGTFGVATRTAAGKNIDVGVAPKVTITDGALTSVSLAPSVTTAGHSENLVMTFTLTNPWPKNGRLLVTFPATAPALDPSGFTTATSDVSGTVGGTLSGNVVTVLRNDDGSATAKNTVVTVTLQGIRNTPVSGATSALTLATQGLLTNGTTWVDIDHNASATATITPGTLTVTSVTPASLVAGATGNVDVIFTPENPWPKDGVLTVTLPAFTVSGAMTITGSVTGGGLGTFTGFGSSGIVTITRQNDGTDLTSAHPITITIQGVTNPHVTGTTATFSLATKTAGSAAIIDTGSSASGATITAGALSAVSLAPASMTNGTAADLTLAFTPANPLPSDGIIVVDFPAPTGAPSWFTAGTLTVAAQGGSPPDGFSGATWSGNKLTITRAGTAAFGGAMTLKVSGLTPVFVGTAGPVTVSTTTAGTLLIDTLASVTGVTIDPGALAGGSVGPTPQVQGTPTDIVIGLSPTNGLPTNGKIVVTFPANDPFTVGTLSIAGQTVVDGTLTPTWSAASHTLTLTRAPGTTTTGAMTVTVTGFTPAIAGTTGTFTISTTTSGDVLIDSVSGVAGILINVP